MSSYSLHLDESLRGRFLAVGGFAAAMADLPEVERRWEGARGAIGVQPGESLKWSYSQNSPVRSRVEEAGWTNIERRRVMIEVLRAAPIILLADVLYDDRDGRRGPLDFYRHALDWLVLRFRNFVTDLNPAPSGPHLVVLDQPSPARAARPPYNNPQFEWLRHREHIWYVHYAEKRQQGFQFNGGGVRPLREDGFYPSVVLSHAKYNVLLEVADAVAGLALDFAQYNVERAIAEQLPELSWQDEQLIRVAARFRADPTGNIFNWGFALFPARTPAHAQVADWVRNLCTNPDFAPMRQLP